MPFRSQAQRRYLYATHPRVAEEFASKTPKGVKLPEHVKRRKGKRALMVNNHMKEYGNEDNGKIEINVKKHRGDKAELADTIKHELIHRMHPSMKEKTVYKKTAKAMKEMSYVEKEALTKKLRMKKLNYKSGAIKRKLKITRSENVAPGDMIRKSREAKLDKRGLAIRGLV
jgi:hypothetical protein